MPVHAASSAHRNMLLIRLSLLILAVALMGVLLAAHRSEHPSRVPWFPKCPSYTLLGVHCPGCGTGRATHHLLNGRFDAAMASNAMAVLLLPACILVAARQTWHWLVGNSPRPFNFPAALSWSLVILIVAFTIARNLPWEPFNLLAPRSLADSP